ncbi:MAG: hypothetical protein A2219_03465 [Elusimicrobia bacterium RIFOXYA2_FULL_50_26]|nr:MAG: hypothetical protein A2219_03465 [Elusimicrobia bacterium RIFOXYA2_FULL_50_26]OGS25355.1 MAG: hypothetical protein A2314_06455 [Elusimicrobia bacterium RIFOXYB2_FULL_50_12]
MDKEQLNRRKVLLLPEEVAIFKWLFLKSLGPIVVTLIASCAVLFLGVQFAINQVFISSFGGMQPAFSLHKIPQFIYTYLYLASANILLMTYVCFVVIYILVRNLVLPVMRITREMKKSLEENKPVKVGFRKNDLLMMPLAETINKLAEKANVPTPPSGDTPQ